MYNFCTGMLVLFCAAYAGMSIARNNVFMAVICVLAGAFFYTKLERNTLDK